MRRFLVVGCGGSGGSTLAYLMDQLRSDLAQDGVQALPPGWQFVQVDVPAGIEQGPEGLGNVFEQGGRYLGLGPQSGRYGDLDYALSQRLAPSQGLGELATWAPRRPDAERTPISVGAGQYRALGRAILLSRASEVSQQCASAWGTLVDRSTITAMEDLAYRTHSSFSVQDPPIILVVSSMAGGAGASMALDVCRLLSLVTNVEPSLMSVFMLTPDVFDDFPTSARAGIRANALAMLGEIVASQTGAALRSDAELLSALGRHDSGRHEVPFARVFPVGRFAGVERAKFGDGSPGAVYRGLARGLAGLMMSDVASDQFVSYDLGNNNPEPTDPKYLGWGAPAAALPWGSFGFASLSMGRDRYAEYAAQRIARASVDRLMDGHLQRGSDASGTEQVKAQVDSQWASTCDELGLPSALVGRSELGQWFTGTAFPRAEVAAGVTSITDDVLAFDPPQVSQASHLLNHLQRSMRDAKPTAVARAEDFAYRAAVSWQLALLSRVEVAVTRGISRFGLPYAGGLLERLSELLVNALIPGTETMSKVFGGDLSELPADLVVSLSARKGTISGGTEVLRTVKVDARDKLNRQIYASIARHLAAAMKEFVPGVISPLQTAIADAYQVLERARASQVTHDGLARLATDRYAAWPLNDDDARVPERFGEADNEVMLTPSSSFPGHFQQDLPNSLDPDERGHSPSGVVVTQVVSGLWRTLAGVHPPGGLLESRDPWWPRAFNTDPTSGQVLRASDARYDVHTRPAELRRRAQAYVARPDRSFSVFCSTSMRAYIEAAGESEVTAEDRRRDLASKFRQALAMAVPLISVNAQAVKVMHGTDVQYRYKFSAIPLQELPVVADLENALKSNRSIDESTKTNFTKALTLAGDPRRIDIFGSYPLYLPLAFDSILDPVIQQWDSTPPQGRGPFWKLRRARPLDASLPMGDRERQAMVAGWYVGQIVGEIAIPEEPYATPVEIWDPEHRRWIGFPHPLLTPPQRFLKPFDWLPAVLESILLAMARVQQEPVMASLRPYHLLRELFDSRALDVEADAGAGTGMFTTGAEAKLATWLQSGSRSGRPSRIASIAAASTPEERFEAAREWLRGPLGPGQLAREDYLPPGVYGARGTGEFSVIRTRTQAGQTPIFRDLAADIVRATAELDTLLSQANAGPKVAPTVEVEAPSVLKGPTF